MAVGLILVGVILSIAGTMYEILPSCFRYSSLVGGFLVICGLMLVGLYFEYPEEDQLF